MALPKQVQAQLAEVEEYEKALLAQQNPDQEELDTETEVVPETEEAPVLEEVKPADTPPTDVEDDFKQKYSTLQGKYSAEVPRLHQQVRDLTTELEQIRKDLSAPKDEPTKLKEKVSYVTDADRAEFGEELLDVQRRVAKEVSQEYEDRLEKQDAVITSLQDKIANTGNQVGEMDFNQRLRQLVPEFSEIDNDDRWVAWLNEHDPMLRAPRRVKAQEAFDTGDAEAIAHYVGLWKATFAEPGVSDKPARQAELEKQVAPNRTANSVRTKSVGQESKVYSTREVDAAWTKVRTLNTQGKYDAAEKLEAELTVAYMEGRVKT
tara:strand:- start:561 stop:1520 length:960 start_codon:yes stop_codon:yes gene_type:complete